MAIARALAGKPQGVRSGTTTSTAHEISTQTCMNFPANRVEYNTRIFTIMGSLSWLPCTFELQGKRMNGTMSKVRRTFWRIQLALSIVYALYINLTLAINISRGTDTIDHLLLGTHFTRSMFSAKFSYWAYQMYIVYFPDQSMLYAFAQSSPGEPSAPLIKVCNAIAIVALIAFV